MAAKIICPKVCEDKHTEHRITMAEIKNDLKYIREKLDENSEKILEIFNNKADKEEVAWLKSVVYGCAITIMGLLGAGLVWLFVYWMQHH